MTYTRFPLFVFISILALTSFAQDNKDFTPTSKFTGTIFANYHSGITENTDTITGMALKRAYLRFDHQFSREFSAQLTVDVNSKNTEDVTDRYVFLKFAYLRWQKERWQVDFGVIPIPHFKLQQRYWGHRYVYKTLQNQNKMGTTADMGACVTYNANKNISLDFTMRNGEGFREIQGDNDYLYGIGTILKLPAGFISRIYGDVFNSESVRQSTICGFVGYKSDLLTTGLEYSNQNNHRNREGNDLRGWSTFASLDFDEHWQLFGRYDDVTTTNKETVIGGVQYAPINNVKLAMNYQGVTAEDQDAEGFIYMNLEVRF